MRFGSTMAEALVLGTLSFFISVIIGAPYIRILRAYKIGKKISIDSPASHQVKMGTPTMGGLMMTVPVSIVTAFLNLPGRLSMLLPLGMILGCGILGGVDDWMTLIGNGRRRGLRARFKFGWLLVMATIAAFVLYFLLKANSFFPFVRGAVNIGLWYIPIAIVAIEGTAHAVNLSDGLDSLAGLTLATAFVAYGIIAYLQGQAYLVAFCFTVAGALLAFLWYNANPAQVFMGDTGSLALGATLAVVAFMTGQWILLPVVGLVFVAEAMSDIIQVTYFKLTKGKRFFKMAPLHHHCELLGWSEVQVVQRFWLVSILAAMLGIALALV